MTSQPSLLAELPGAHDHERLVVLLQRDEAGHSHVSLRQQTWAEGIGWFDQKSIDLDPEQLNQLRSVLGWSPRATRRVVEGDQPATLPFPSVSARAVNS